MNRKNLLFGIFGLLLLGLASCNKDKEADIEYIPFQEEEDDRWGMISPDGKVLCSEEFSNVPTPATCGRFWVMNAQGYYELFTTDKEPKQIGDEFRYISQFYRGKAFATPRDGEISVINRDGEVVKSIQKVDDIEISYLVSINEGHGVAQVDTLQGLINFDGEWIIKPRNLYIGEMHQGHVVANDSQFWYYANSNDSVRKKEKIKEQFAYVFNKKGEEVLKLSGKKYSAVAPRIYGNYLPVAKADKDNSAWGIIDLKGDVVLKPSSKYRDIVDMHNDVFVYRNDDGKCGVKKIDGTSIVKAKYDNIYFSENGMMLAQDLNSADAQWIYLDSEGSPINNKHYIEASFFLPRGGKYAFACSEDNKWKILAENGEILADIPKMFNISMNYQTSALSTDNVNIGNFLKKVNFSAQSLDSLTFSSSVQNVIMRQNRYFNIDKAPKASDYTSTKEITIYRDINGIPFSEVISFPGNLAKPTYRQETVIDYVDYYWGYYYYHTRNVPTGTVFNAYTPNKFTLEFDNYGVFRGKLRALYNALVNKFENMGSKIGSNGSATLISLDGKNQALIVIKANGVTASWGALGLSESSLAQYDGVKEKLEQTLDLTGLYSYSPLFPGFTASEEEGD